MVTLTRNTSDGIGVYRLTLIWDRISGMWPLRAPTKHIRDEVMMCTERPPKAEMATRMGMTKAPQPMAFWANVCEEMKR